MASGDSSGKPAEFMSEYMSGLNQSQDLNSFLQKNQPAFDPNSHSSSSSSGVNEASSSNIKDAETKSQNASSGSSSTSSTSSSSSTFTASSGSTQKPIDLKMLAASQAMTNGHLHYQRQAIQSAAMDNCADLNMELSDCLAGKTGTWWERASMCMKAKEQLQKCCRLNREILQEKGYAREGNTPEQDREIMDYADDHVQKAMKEEKPKDMKARATKAITLVGDDLYLYGGSGSDGTCYSDFYSLHLDPTNGWLGGNAPWNNIQQENSPVLGANSWAVASTDGNSLLFYGQTLCPNLETKDPGAQHSYSSTSGSVQFQRRDSSWTRTATATDVLGPRLVPNDVPVPVQAIDTKGHIDYTFVYDAFNAQLGMQLWSFPTDHLPSNIAQSAKNITMVTAQPIAPPPPPPSNGTNSTTPAPVPPVGNVVLAPYMDPGNAVYLDGSIIVVGGGRQGLALSGDDVDLVSGLYKTDRCFIYTIATGLWSVRNLSAPGGSFPLSRNLAALVAVGTKIYMHGGNTTATVPADSYAKDLWILDTQTWQWTSGPASMSGRAHHTLIPYQNSLLSVSGFEFETTKSRAAQNGFIMVYDLGSSTWGTQFGTINETYFQKHGVVIIAGSLAGFLLIILIAAVCARLWRKHTGRRPTSSGLARKLTQKFTNKPFLATTAAHKPSAMDSRSTAAASQLSGMTQTYPSQGTFETQIDLSALPRFDDSGSFHQHQSPKHQLNPYASMNQQQRVPLMSDNALENQGHELDPYKDDYEPEVKDGRPFSNVPPHFNNNVGSVPQVDSISYPGQTAGISGVPVRGEMAIRSMTPDTADNGPTSG
ncbi:hypothetical protein BGX27_009139 [Mortierella sp. AM989]|nr:hypothetical protein BGX27_009139 [Mortierella sp. AM989]